MEKVITATGKRFETDYFNPFPQARQLYIRILGKSLIDVVSVFSNPEETVQLWCGNQYVANYTRVAAIIPETDAVRVVLGEG